MPAPAKEKGEGVAQGRTRGELKTAAFAKEDAACAELHAERLKRWALKDADNAGDWQERKRDLLNVLDDGDDAFGRLLRALLLGRGRRGRGRVGGHVRWRFEGWAYCTQWADASA